MGVRAVDARLGHHAAVLVFFVQIDMFEQRIDEQLWKQGVVAETREPIGLATGPGFLVVGHQEAGGVRFRRWILIGSTPEFTAIDAQLWTSGGIVAKIDDASPAGQAIPRRRA